MWGGGKDLNNITFAGFLSMCLVRMIMQIYWLTKVSALKLNGPELFCSTFKKMALQVINTFAQKTTRGGGGIFEV